MAELNIALAHLEVRRGRPEENLAELLRLFRQAADEGAQIAAGPEMCLSGYCFESREEIAPHVQEAQGPAGRALGELAGQRGMFIVAAWAERDGATGIFYNSAFVFGPDGALLRSYRKVNAESRWACPGPPVQDNVFETPWGRMGLLVCADSYHGLLPRVTALKGADLIFVPANWPDSGLAPTALWRQRARENGGYILAVNRTGQDADLDCRSGRSCLAAPDGQMLLDRKSEISTLMWARPPLDERGRLAGLRRAEIMGRRRPGLYYRALGNLTGIEDLTGFLKLPAPGLLDLYCLIPAAGENPVEALERRRRRFRPGALIVLPKHRYDDSDLERLGRLARSGRWAVTAARRTAAGLEYFWRGKTENHWPWPAEISAGYDFPRLDYGPARILLAPLAELAQPELALSAAKWGCDLAVSSEHALNEEGAELASLRPIEQVALAVCAKNGAAIGHIPQGHKPGRGVRVLADDLLDDAAGGRSGDICSCVLDTRETRRKRFQDRVDFEALFSR